MRVTYQENIHTQIKERETMEKQRGERRSVTEWEGEGNEEEGKTGREKGGKRTAEEEEKDGRGEYVRGGAAGMY